MGKYYKIDVAVDTPETGSAYPAVESYPDYDFKNVNSVYNLKPNAFPDFCPEIRFKLAKNAKLCDVLSQSTISAKGILLNKKLLNILTSLKSISNQSYKATINYSSESYPYYWLHLIWENAIDFVNFDKSKFEIVEFGYSIGAIDIKNEGHMIEEQTKLGFMKIIHAKEVFLNNPNFDLFTHPFNNTIYISKKLKDLIILNKITGISIEKPTSLFWQSQV